MQNIFTVRLVLCCDIFSACNFWLLVWIFSVQNTVMTLVNEHHSDMYIARYLQCPYKGGS